jgi:maltose alpha-D-glucosyltransferase/alpha-amylase
LLALVTERHSEEEHRFFLPMGVEWAIFQELPQALQPRAFAKVRRGPQEGLVIDATALPEFASHFIEAMVEGETIEGPGGTIRFIHTDKMPAGGVPADILPSPNTGEQSNSSVLLRGFGVLKFYRHLVSGIQPEVEIGVHLTSKKVNVPPVLGYAELDFGNGETATIAVLHAFAENQGDGWAYTLNYLNRTVDHYVVLDEKQAAAAANLHTEYLDFARKLGQRTAELHLALAEKDSNPAFAPEPVRQTDVENWLKLVRDRAVGTFERLRSRGDSDDQIRSVLDREADVEGAIAHLFDGIAPEGVKTRVHGDYHLGQVLVASGDVVIVDFEGEPRLPIPERRHKNSPLVDVAGMLRSFDYAAWTALERTTTDYPAKRPMLEKLLASWRDQTVAAFEEAYWSTAHKGKNSTPSPFESALVKLLMISKAFYEVNYEIENRPAWIHIPLSGIAQLLVSKGNAL